MAIVYNQEEDFHTKTRKFGAKLKEQNQRAPTQKAKKKFMISHVSKQASAPNDAISMNIQSIKTKPTFRRLVCYSTNCLATISEENKFNCDVIVEKGGIDTMTQVLNHHSSNPAIMKEVSRTITNIAEANSIHAQKISNSGLLQKCMKTLQKSPKETGKYAVEIMHSALKCAENKSIMAQTIIAQNNGLKILQSTLQNSNNPNLCASVIAFIDDLIKADSTIASQFADKHIWSSIMNAMKLYPDNGYLAIAATKALTTLALLNPNYANTIRKLDGVCIISKCMQCNPELKPLIYCGAEALRVFANNDDISQALMVLYQFDKYDNVIITQALGILGNLALIQENTQFIVEKGGLNCLMNIISYKCKKEQLSVEEVVMIGDSIRAMGRLLNDKNMKSFVNKGGVELLDNIMKSYEDKEIIINAVVDCLGNLVPIFETDMNAANALMTATHLICKHPNYTVLLQKYGGILCDLSLHNSALLNSALNAGLLTGIQQSLSINADDIETTQSIFGIIKNVIMAKPALAEQIIHDNGQNMMKAMEAYLSDAVLLQTLLDTAYVIGTVDGNLAHLDKIGFNNVLSKVLTQDNVSEETVAMIQTFIEKIHSANIDCDLSHVFAALKQLQMDHKIRKTVQETEAKCDSAEEPLQNSLDSAPVNVRYDIFPIHGQNQVDRNNFKEYNTETLMTTMRESKDPRIIVGTIKETTTRLQGGDRETFNNIIQGGGLGILFSTTDSNMGNPAILNSTLDAVGTLSTNTQLRQLLGMHGTIRLILQVMRAHPNDIELLDKCCYILSNLTFNNEANMTAIIELGGVRDIVSAIMKHNTVNFLCESAINVLVNLQSNSDKNKVLICRSGGAKATINALKLHNGCKNDGDEALVVSCLKCLGNLAYINDNVTQLIRLDVVAHVIDTMNQNTDKKDLIDIGIVVLANLSSHERNASRMVQLGVLDLVIKVSQSYPNEMAIQRSCLGCVGNLMNEQSNAVEFIDKKGHLRVFEIMQELVFEESVVITALKLLKILATNGDIATELCIDGGCKVVAEMMEENKSNQDILVFGCQAISKMIVTMEAATHIQKDGICEMIIDIAKDNNNWANIQIMNELIKVIVNISSVEENAQLIARNGSVPILRAIEAHKTNAVFLNNSALALTKLSVHPLSSKPLIKRGAIPVILASMQANPTRKGILTRYVRTLANFLYTEHRSGQQLAECNGYEIVKELVGKHPNYQPLQSEFMAFKKIVTKASQFHPRIQNNESIRNQLDTYTKRFLLCGTVIKKYGKNGKGKKKLLRVNDDCNLLLFEDTNDAKPGKQLNVRSIKNVISGINSTVVLQKCNPSNTFVVISMDPNGREFKMIIECKTTVEATKWVSGLQAIIQVMSSNSHK